MEWHIVLHRNQFKIMQNIIIIGGLSAGPSAAAKARREDETANITLFEKTDAISYATCGIPYALSGHIPSREKLLVTDVNVLRNRFKVDVRLNEEVLDIDTEKQEVETPLGRYRYDKLIFATGARSFVPPIENLHSAQNWSTCRSLADFDQIKARALKPEVKHVTIMGGGLIGIEVAENLIHAGKKVTLIEGGPHILPMWQPKFSSMAENVLEDKGIELIKNTFVKRVEISGENLAKIDLGHDRFLETDYLIMSVGIKPNTEILLNKGAKALPNGALIVDEKFETSLPNIYAAGDNAAILNLMTNQADYMPLGTHSNKGGRAAGVNAVGGNEKLYGGYKTAIIQLFNFTMARTGCSPKDLSRRGVNFKRNLIVAHATPSYYPNPTDLIIETYYDAADLTLLGAEIFGQVGVDKRVDVLSTAIYAKLKITDLPQLDLAYAPPYSPAKDPIVVSGHMASNLLNGGYEDISVEELHELISENSNIQIIDVRTHAERTTDGHIKGSIHIPLDDLREKLDLVSKNRPVVVHCIKGLRGYLAYKILKNNGFEHVKNLAGGYLVWSQYERQNPVSYSTAYELV